MCHFHLIMYLFYLSFLFSLLLKKKPFLLFLHFRICVDRAIAIYDQIRSTLKMTILLLILHGF